MYLMTFRRECSASPLQHAGLAKLAKLVTRLVTNLGATVRVGLEEQSKVLQVGYREPPLVPPLQRCRTVRQAAGRRSRPAPRRLATPEQSLTQSSSWIFGREGEPSPQEHHSQPAQI